MKKALLNSFLILACSASLVSCNKSEGYTKIVDVSSIEGDLEGKIMCAEAQNLEACTALKEQCTIVYGDSEDAEGVRPFSACIDNPNEPTPPADPILPPADPADPADPVVVDLPEDEIPVEDFIESKASCANLDEKFLIRKGKGQAKVLVCHSNSHSAVTISVACPALKAHAAHHDGKDTIGVCK